MKVVTRKVLVDWRRLDVCHQVGAGKVLEERCVSRCFLRKIFLKVAMF